MLRYLFSVMLLISIFSCIHTPPKIIVLPSNYLIYKIDWTLNQTGAASFCNIDKNNKIVACFNDIEGEWMAISLSNLLEIQDLLKRCELNGLLKEEK